MPINQLTSSNTFQQWLTSTTSLIGIANSLTDGPTITANTLLTLSATGTSLNVRNVALINVITSNTINTSIANIRGSGFAINVANSLWVSANAVINGNLTVGNLIITGTSTLTTPSFVDLSPSGNVAVTGWLTVGRWINQTGANSSFLGQIAFNNVGTSFAAAGNISVTKSATLGNVLVSGGVVNTSNLIVTSGISGNALFRNNISVSGTTTLSGNVVITGNTTMGPYTESVRDFGASVTTSQTCNLRVASFFRANLAASVTFTFTNPPEPGRVGSATLMMRQDGVGGRVATIAVQNTAGIVTKLKYSYDTFPSFDTTAGEVNIINVFTVDGGNNWYLTAPILSSNTA